MEKLRLGVSSFAHISCVCVCVGVLHLYVCVSAKLLHLCLTLCDPMDCSLPGSSVHESLHARILEWVSVPSPRGSSGLRDKAHVSYISSIGRWVLTTSATQEALCV